jgi:hypothetical protein
MRLIGMLTGLLRRKLFVLLFVLILFELMGVILFCLDAERDNEFFEIKSVRIGHKVVIYDWRLKKELNSGVNVYYAILGREVKTNGTPDLISLFASRRLELLLIDLATVQSVADAFPLRKIKTLTVANKRNGYHRKGYEEGYKNIDWKYLRATTHFSGYRFFQLHGVDFRIALRKTNG